MFEGRKFAREIAVFLVCGVDGGLEGFLIARPGGIVGAEGMPEVDHAHPPDWSSHGFPVLRVSLFLLGENSGGQESREQGENDGTSVFPIHAGLNSSRSRRARGWGGRGGRRSFSRRRARAGRSR